MMKMNELTGKFRKNHPKLLRFFDAAQNRIDAGSIIEIKITMSSGESITVPSNFFESGYFQKDTSAIR